MVCMIAASLLRNNVWKNTAVLWFYDHRMTGFSIVLRKSVWQPQEQVCITPFDRPF